MIIKPSVLKIITLLTLLTPYAANAEGAKVGGGGGAVECKNSVKFIDLYAATTTPGSDIEIVRSNVAMKTQLANALAKASPGLRKEMQNVYGQLKVVYLPANQSFEKKYDLGDSPVILEDGCTVKWAAYLDDTTNTLQIVSKYFNRMSPTDQAALMVHEMIYLLMRRLNGETDSSSTREIVPLFFSNSDQSEKIEELTVSIRHPAERVIELNGATGGFKIDVTTQIHELTHAWMCTDAKGTIIARVIDTSHRLRYSVVLPHGCSYIYMGVPYFKLGNDNTRFLEGFSWTVSVSGDLKTEIDSQFSKSKYDVDDDGYRFYAMIVTP